MSERSTTHHKLPPLIGRILAAAMAVTLWGCAAHEVYDKADLSPSVADDDWAKCQAEALAAVGEPADLAALRGKTSVSGHRLFGTMATLDVGNGTMYSPADYLKIKTRQSVLQACMRKKGYDYIGVPAIEAL